jgi:hypothetical protein
MRYIILLCLLLLLALPSGCQNGDGSPVPPQKTASGTPTANVLLPSPGDVIPPPGKLNGSEVRAFADPAVENLLQAMNAGDYARYTAQFDEQLKKNITRGVFDLLNPKKIAVVGNYISRDFAKMVVKDDRFVLTYKAAFSKEPAGVTVTVIVRETGGQPYISGLNFDSPLMREGNCC